MKREKTEMIDSSMNLNLTSNQVKRMSAEELEKFSHDFISKVSPSFFSSIKVNKNLQAKIIAMYVRNNIEDFHVKYLSDDAMKELNPLIRNAIYTALVDFETTKVKLFLQNNMVPTYWEDCEYCKKI